jgi:predicted site-specific integrase-resolvase
MYVKPKDLADFLGVADSTVRRWAITRKIDVIHTPNGYRLYKLDDDLQEAYLEERNRKNGKNPPKQKLEETRNVSKNVQIKDAKIKAIYTRVSSNKQKDDLARQRTVLSNQYPEHRIYQDIGSGINFKRRSLLTLLEHTKNGLVEEVVVASKDRLSRIAFDLFEWFFGQYDCKLIVCNNTNSTEIEEWESELLSIVQIFCCRWNGKRRYKKEES